MFSLHSSTKRWENKKQLESCRGIFEWYSGCGEKKEQRERNCWALYLPSCNKDQEVLVNSIVLVCSFCMLSVNILVFLSSNCPQTFMRVPFFFPLKLILWAKWFANCFCNALVSLFFFNTQTTWNIFTSQTSILFFQPFKMV